jgi:hypothetical protein
MARGGAWLGGNLETWRWRMLRDAGQGRQPMPLADAGQGRTARRACGQRTRAEGRDVGAGGGVFLQHGEEWQRIDGVTPAAVAYGGQGTVQVEVPAESLQKALARRPK